MNPRWRRCSPGVVASRLRVRVAGGGGDGGGDVGVVVGTRGKEGPGKEEAGAEGRGPGAAGRTSSLALDEAMASGDSIEGTLGATASAY